MYVFYLVNRLEHCGWRTIINKQIFGRRTLPFRPLQNPQFQIDFQCGSAPSPRPDVAFHFNARFDESCMVGNSFERGNWQHEQRKQDMPFRKGHPFEIRTDPLCFCLLQVAVDGRHVFEFIHRIPLYRVEAISVSGGIEVASINFQGPVRSRLFGGRS
uniref:Galectin n=1 Tax=Anolis carolinensis TaxID=28377 RepID=A0A803SLB7_ANOCA